MKLPKKILARQIEITQLFFTALDNHIEDILSGKAEQMYEIRDLAEKLNIHPTHLSNTIKLSTGKSPCDFFEEKIMEIAKNLLKENQYSIAEIATRLTFDPSNFTKFFKRFAGTTPGKFREAELIKKLLKEEKYENSETLTI